MSLSRTVGGSRFFIAPLTLIVGLVTIAACGGGGKESAASGSTSAAKSPSAQAYSACMRSHGVPNFPDPDANGNFALTITPGSGLDPNSATYKAADKACASLRPAGIANGGGNGGNSQLLKFSKCMRANGVPDFPDPQANGGLIMGQGNVDPNSPQFKAAMQKCQSLLPNGATTGQ